MPRPARIVSDPPATDPAACPVCESTGALPHARLPALDYWRCRRCEAIFLSPSQRLDPQREAAYYRLHRNDIDDPGYRRFLSRLCRPLLARLPTGARGLDFGCGPGPALAQMLGDAGMHMAVYDPEFFPERAVLAERYDFVTCSEVVEHLHHPARVFAELFAMLRPGGLLAIMTGFPPADDGFAQWHYRRDPTHVVFYEPATLHWLAQQHDADCEIPCRNVALLQRRA